MTTKTCDVTIILDKSGSMASLRDTTIGSINGFIEEVSKEPGQGYWTLIQFDDWSSSLGGGEAFPTVTFEAVPDQHKPRLTTDLYQPRGGTALVDAVCIAILRTRERIEKLPANEKPKVLMMIVTDGEENTSRQYTTDKMRELTAQCMKDGWQFMYLGANQDAFAVTRDLNLAQGMSYAGLATGGLNALPMEYTAGGMQQCLASGSIGVRAWKADGNPTAEQLLSSVGKDNP